MSKKNLFRAKVSVAVLAIPVVLLAFSGGPDPGKAGVPGEGLCVQCHLGTANSGSGSVTVAFPSGMTYTPGAGQRLTVTVADPDQQRWGFQLTARREVDPTAQAGTFAPADGNSQVKCSTPTAPGDQAPCTASTLQYIEHTSAGTRNGQTGSATFTFDWTPPATDVGSIVIYVAGNAANGNNNPTGDHIYTQTYTLTPATGGPKPTIAEDGVTNGATFLPGIAQGSWVTIKGTDFGTSSRTWRADEIVDGKLPTQLDNVAVNINGKPAFVYYISPGQINVQAPSDDSLGDVPVEVIVNGVKSDPVMARLQKHAPGFFPWPDNQVVATDANFNLKVKSGTFEGVNTTPAKPGEIILLWGTGFGPTDPSIPAGQVVDASVVRAIVDAPTIRIGNAVAEYLGGALSSPSVGLYQIAVRVPESTPDGDHSIVAEVGGVQSPDSARITVQR